MTIDVERLTHFARREDRGSGITEEFVQPVLGLGRTIGILARPAEDEAPTGWVICHSFGMEYIHLGRLDTIVARAVAAAGFPVLRFHGQGYGDSELGMEAITLSSHTAEVADAVAYLRDQHGVERVGLMGARFGAVVAALVADRLDLPFLILWDPAVKGATFMRDLLRKELLAKIAGEGGGGGAADMERLRADLAGQGWVDIRGFRLNRQAYEETNAVDLGAEIRSFSGRALVVAVSRSGRMGGPIEGFAKHLESIAAPVEAKVVEDPHAAQFGQYRYQTISGGLGKQDVLLELSEKLAAVTADWCSAVAGTPSRAEV